MATPPSRRVRSAPGSLTADELAAEQIAELSRQRGEIESRTLERVAKWNTEITKALTHRDSEVAEIDRMLAELDELRSGRPVIARDDYSGPKVEVYHYLDGQCDKRPVRGRIMYEPQAKALGLRPANCRCGYPRAAA